jgi:DNA-binding SARP family transcriptional activator
VLFRVLGDIAVVRDGRVVSIPGSRLRALLALLVLDANRPLPRATLIDDIWGDDPPEHGEAALQVVMSRLRRAVGPAAAECIRFEGGGYRLDVGPEEVDLTRVEMLLRDGRVHLAAHNASLAAEAFEQALACWNGEPLADLVDFPFHAAAVRRLHELHLTVYEARNDAYLNAGRHLEVLADIDAWTARERMREHLRGQQITALYRSGRQADALAVATEVRKALRDELGVNLSPPMQDLERRVLDQDPTLLATDAGIVPALPPWTAETVPFVGREAECDRIVCAMRDASRKGFFFALVEGPAGRGKSRLLLEVARRIGTDAVVVPVDVHESLQPTIVALASGIAAATRRLSPPERALLLPDDDIPQADVPAEEMSPIDAARALQRLSLKAPVLVLIDDLDRSGASMLQVVGELALMDDPKRVLVVASARDTESHMVDRLYNALNGTGQAMRLPLEPLSEDDINEVLARMRIAPRKRLVSALNELTRGDPFMLSELLSSGQPERVTEQWPVPPRVRDVVLARVDGLGRGALEVLHWAALVQFDFAVATIAEISGIAPGTVATMVERAVDAHLLQPSGALTYRFVHDLARRVVAEEWSEAERAEAHRRIALVLEESRTDAVGLAAHWARASGPEAPSKTAKYARLAGDDALRVHAPVAAVAWYELALSRVKEPRERAEVLVRLAHARQQAGQVSFSDALHEAADIALQLDDDELVVQVVTATSPGFVSYDGFTRDETLPLVERALAVAHEPSVRSRVLARLADEQHVLDVQVAKSALAEAEQLARACGDHIALLHVLLRQIAELITPDRLAERERAIDEAVLLAVDANDVAAQYSLYGLRAIAAVERGHIERADDAIARAERIADHYEFASMRWSALIRNAWRTALRGDVVAAQELIAASRAYGEAHGVAHAAPNGLLQFVMLRWQESRVAEVLGLAQELDPELSGLPGMRLVRARGLAARPELHADAHAILADIGLDGIRNLPETSFRTTILMATAETAHLLRLPDVGSVVLEQLVPFAGQVACPGNWVTGPIAYGAAVAAATACDTRAGALFEQAIAMAEQLRAPLLRARTQVAWAVTTRGAPPGQRPPDPEALCADAVSTAAECGATVLSAIAQRALDRERESTGH